MSNHTHQKNVRSLKTLKAYIFGLLGSLVLTLISFGLVAKHTMSATSLLITIMSLAVVQLFVQVTCFLRLNNSPEGRWDLMPFLSAILVVLVLVIGSMWIMFNLNYNMMN